MSTSKSAARRRKGLGRIQHWDPRNEDYLLGDVRPGLAAVARGLHPKAVEIARNMDADGTARAMGATEDGEVARAILAEPRRSRRWRQLWSGDQGATPRCTAFGTLTALHCLQITHRPRPKVDPQTLYEEIQAIDRAAGRYYSEGATTNAAMEAARARGLIGGYWWAETPDVALDTLAADGATVNGTNWYPSMWERDAEGIVTMPRPGEAPAGGHLWCANGYDAKRDLVRNPETWGDGVYWIPGELYRRLLHEDGECAAMRELPDV